MLAELVMYQVDLILPYVAEDLNDAGPVSSDVFVDAKSLLNLFGRRGAVENHPQDDTVFKTLRSALCLLWYNVINISITLQF